MKSTYYTKCGRPFQKTSNALVTGYRMDPNDMECHGDPSTDKGPCPFRNEVTKGWPPVFDCYECRAGSKKPNHKNDYSTNMNDKTTMHAKSLDIEFLKDVQEFCGSLEGCDGIGYNSDLEDCRRQLSISFTQNKKGLAAKRQIVEKFFSTSQKGKTNLVQPEDDINLALSETSYGRKCPYLSSQSEVYIQCTLAFRSVGRKEFEDSKSCNEYFKCFCYDNFDNCDTYKETFKKQMESNDEQIKELYKCAHCCNNSGYTGLKNHDGSKYGFCVVWQEDKEKYNENCVCRWFNKRYRPGAPENDEQCDLNKGEDPMDCKIECDHKRDNKCTIESISGRALEFTVRELSNPGCDTMKAARKKYLKEGKHCSHANVECNAVLKSCAMNNQYCCYTCKNPCDSFCDYSKDLVPYGLLKDEDKNLNQPAELIVNDDEEDESSLNNHLRYIQNKCEDIVNNYVVIGFTLINMKNNNLYVAKGYNTLVECVEAELGMKKSTCYNLIRIAEKFGDPERKTLKEDFKPYGYVQLLEMTTMSEDEIQHVSPEMSKREIQRLKSSNRLESNISESADPIPSPIETHAETFVETSEDEIEAYNGKDNNNTNNGLEQLINDYNNGAIDVEYSEVLQDHNKQKDEELNTNLNDNTAADESSGNVIELPFHCNVDEDQIAIEDTILKSTPNSEMKVVHHDETNSRKIDELIERVNKLETDNTDLSDKIRELSALRSGLFGLVKEIDKRMSTLTKQQIRDVLNDYIMSGEMHFDI